MFVTWMRLSFSAGVPRRSLIVALVVGTLLNFINQGDRFAAGLPIDWLKLCLTYCVPYCVATYGAVSLRLRQMREAEAAASTRP